MLKDRKKDIKIAFELGQFVQLKTPNALNDDSLAYWDELPITVQQLNI